MTQEIWKDLPDFEGMYKISNLGNVLSFKKYAEGKLMKPVKVGRGNQLYFNAQKMVGCKKISKRYKISRIVCELFNGPQPSENEEFVTFIDRNPLNICASNLKWATRNEVANINKRGSAEKRGVRRSVAQKTKDGKTINIFESMTEAARYFDKKKPTSIYEACEKIIPTAYGYVWDYLTIE